MLNRPLGNDLRAAAPGGRPRISANNQLIERAVALACLLILSIGVFLVMQPFLSALLWGTILTISTWPLHVRLRRALGGRTGASAALLTLAACAVFLIPLALLGQNLAENVGQLAAKLEEWRSNEYSSAAVLGSATAACWLAAAPVLVGIGCGQR